MARDVEHYHRELLAILAAHGRGRGGGQDLPEQRAPYGLAAAGHQAVRALIEEVHDQGYVLGQLHADGIFPEGGEADVAAREERLGIEELKAQARPRADQVTAVDRLKAARTGWWPDPSGTVHGIRPHLPRTPEQDRAERELAEQYVRDNPIQLPEGLCGNREDHDPHVVTEGSLAPFRCSADQSRRLPHAAERRRQGGNR